VVGVTVASDGTRTFTTKGDNNSTADPTVQPEQIRGVLWYSIPLLGYVSTFVAGSQGSWLVPLAAVLLLGYAAYLIAAGLISAARGGSTSRSGRHRAVVRE
jgi:signal peptidase